MNNHAMSFQINNLKLGGLMGASPYSNVSIFDAYTTHHQRSNGQHPIGIQRQWFPSLFQTPLQQQQKQSQSQVNTPPVIKFVLPDNVIQDVLCRFIMNIPEEEKFDPVRALFQVELAHWFFIDHYCGEDGDPKLAGLAHIPFNQFAYIIFQAAPHLKQYYSEVDKYLAEFRSYRSRVPTFGAILMNKQLTQVVLVQGFRNQWGFPKGKVNENEDPIECAIREVFEETGYDMRPLINPKHYIESKTQERNDRLYLVRGVDLKFPFYPQTQYEIKRISWFNIDELPEHKKDVNPKILSHGQPIANFFTIYPYIKRLKLWITDKLDGQHRIECFRSRWFVSDKEEAENVLSSFQTQTPVESKSFSSAMSSTHTSRLTPGQEIIKSVQEGRSNPKGNASPSGKKAPKGSKSKKRLFTDPDPPNNERNIFAANLISNAIGIPINNSTMKTVRHNQADTVPISTSKSSAKFPILERYNLTAPSWENFQLDKDKLLRALRGNH